jgi:hypothetical protein
MGGCCNPAEPARRASLPTRRDANSLDDHARLRRNVKGHELEQDGPSRPLSQIT